jgi:NAD(P)-dependent dehydrogenase (short-subunit alcohol dehydrogenase family)
MSNFEGKSVIVTGGSGGMGKATAEAFAEAGARVLVADISEAGEGVADGIRKSGGTAVYQRVDVADAASTEAMAQRAVDEFGTLDCAVNMAAIEGETERLADLDVDTFDRIIAINLRSIFLSMKYEIRAMLAAGNGGAIVNIGSTNSFRPQPHQSGYTASKHGVIGLTRSAAIDYAGDGIRINAICPGAIDTPMLRNAIEQRGRDVADVVARLSLVGRLGRSDEIAKAAMWLCSDDSSFTVGHALAVDGGYLAR